MNKILFTFTLLNSIMFCSMKTPLSMGSILLIQTLLIVLSVGLMSFNFWYSYIMFLIMIGGMLILFIYISSLTPALKFSFKINMTKICMYLTVIFIIFIIMNMNMYNSFNSELLNLMNSEMEQNFLLKMSMNKLYNKPTNLIMIMMINYLLMMLFIVVKITNIKMGPLRKLYY
nr:NADH dehydrogenase subunit 6 [Fenusa (Kaliofenusa) sp. 3 GYN-2022b]